ncbi:DUF7266 family protein [Haloarcula salinisoli]|uniref:Uncharacterized protein n=1 Tax=Haloarcula salinisoli TaxID=2487746 RepID=A0A8J8C8Y9_9EURY|nr:hypothetical protein [Halomicroarcula salinisoli]MBX0284863.1 hypothetical protein [Halomicroarcula salinisoli]MBX0303659.1 hypothetical protein [Halomicroarcula salinisoli]
MIRSDSRAVSITLNYTIAIGITTLLTTGLIIGAGGLLESQQERVARQQADEIGADVLSQADRLDRIHESTASSETTVQLEYPSRLVGSTYTISFQQRAGRFDAFSWTLRIKSQALTGDAIYPVPKSISVAESSARGTSPEMSKCQNGTIKFGGC